MIDLKRRVLVIFCFVFKWFLLENIFKNEIVVLFLRVVNEIKNK